MSRKLIATPAFAAILALPIAGYATWHLMEISPLALARQAPEPASETTTLPKPAPITTLDQDAALAIGERVETGTWFMNRCDYLDPALAWTGVKDSGRGCTLSRLGLETFTRPKSFHLRLKP